MRVGVEVGGSGVGVSVMVGEGVTVGEAVAVEVIDGVGDRVTVAVGPKSAAGWNAQASIRDINRTRIVTGLIKAGRERPYFISALHRKEQSIARAGHEGAG